MKAMDGPTAFSPDGLDEHGIDELLWELDAALPVRHSPTTALLDGSAAARRDRRTERRAVARVAAAGRVAQVRRLVASAAISGGFGPGEAA